MYKGPLQILLSLSLSNEVLTVSSSLPISSEYLFALVHSSKEFVILFLKYCLHTELLEDQFKSSIPYK